MQLNLDLYISVGCGLERICFQCRLHRCDIVGLSFLILALFAVVLKCHSNTHTMYVFWRVQKYESQHHENLKRQHTENRFNIMFRLQFDLLEFRVFARTTKPLVIDLRRLIKKLAHWLSAIYLRLVNFWATLCSSDCISRRARDYVGHVQTSGGWLVSRIFPVRVHVQAQA